MRIIFNNQINHTSFQASLVKFDDDKKPKIGRYVPEENIYETTDVNLVRFNPLDKNDLDTLDRIANSWVDDIFSVNIYNNANDIYEKKQKNRNFVPFRDFIYGLTTQKDNFEKLDYRKVLGLCDGRLIDEKKIYMSHLQINPEYVYSSLAVFQSKPFEYKGIGSAIVNALKNMYSSIELSSRREESVRRFYIKNGFTNIPDSLTRFIWKI